MRLLSYVFFAAAFCLAEVINIPIDINGRGAPDERNLELRGNPSKFVSKIHSLPQKVQSSPVFYLALRR